MKSYRIYATCDIGEEGLKRLTDRGYQVEVYPDVEPPPKALIVEKVASGIDGLITTLRDPIDEEVFQAGAGHLEGGFPDCRGCRQYRRRGGPASTAFPTPIRPWC